MKTLSAKKNLRILVVDDNRSIHTDFQKILAGEDTSRKARAMEVALFGVATDPRQTIRYELASAYQGKEALEMVQHAVAAGRPYAVAFMDIRMPPGWDGIETTARIWEVDPGDADRDLHGVFGLLVGPDERKTRAVRQICHP